MGANTVMARLDSVEAEKINGILEAPTLPKVSGSDNGKILKVSDGKWAKVSEAVELPVVSADDNGKVLMVVEGARAVASLPAGEE